MQLAEQKTDYLGLLNPAQRMAAEYGERPDGEYTTGSMEPVIEGIRHLTDSDRNALMDYLRGLPPINNRVRK